MIIIKDLKEVFSKKQIVIFCIIFVSCGLLLYDHKFHGDKSKKMINEQKSKNEVSVFDNSNKRDEAIEQFANNSNAGSTNSQDFNSKNSGGYEGVYVDNNKELLNEFEVNDVLQVEKCIIDAGNEVNKFNDHYFNANKVKLKNLFGVTSNEEYLKIFEKVKPLGKVNYCKIEEGSLKNDNENINLNLILVCKENITFNISISRSDKNDFSLKWSYTN